MSKNCSTKNCATIQFLELKKWDAAYFRQALDSEKEVEEVVVGISPFHKKQGYLILTVTQCN